MVCLGATSFGIGATAIVAALEREIVVLQFSARTLILAAALVPMVFVYKVGAFDQVDTAGSRTFEPARPVLHDITFDVAAGQTVALVGRTGAGKRPFNLVPRFYGRPAADAELTVTTCAA